MPAAACRPALSLSMLSAPRPSCPCRMLPAALRLWPIRLASLPVCERSVSPHLHASFAASVTVDRWQLSVGSNFSVAPWHRAPYVSMCFRCMFHLVLHVFHLDVAYVVLATHVCYKCMFQMFHLLQTYVASVLSVCFIYYNGYTRLL
jgi:hypothetical protein